MKTLFRNSLLIGSLVLISSCIRTEVEENQVAIRLHSDGITETKAETDLQNKTIDENAQFGVFACNADTETTLNNGVNNIHSVQYGEGTSFDLNTEHTIQYPGNGAIDIFAYAPYSEDATLTSFPFTVKEDQSSNANYLASDLIYGKSEDQTWNDSDGVDISISFQHILTKAILYIYPDNSSVDLQGATVTLNNVPRSVTLNPMTGELSNTGNKGDIKVHTFADDQTVNYECAVLFAPHTFTSGETFVTITEKGGKEYRLSLNSNKVFEGKKYYTFGVKVKEDAEIYATEIDNWVAGHPQLNVGDGAIQSLTFMSEFQDGTAAAYYELKDGVKSPKDNIEFNYLVRPASAAKIFDVEYVSPDKFKMIGYYAFTRADYDPIDFTVQTVSAEKDTDENYTGVITVTTNNPLKPEFYQKSTGALVALSVKDEDTSTDFVSKFVTLLPRDVCRDVYVNGLSLSTTSATVETNKTLQIVATVSPGDATNKGVTWEVTSGEDIISVDQNGNITAGNLEGTANILVTTKGTDENGNHLSATIYVKVVKEELKLYITGPTAVETDGSGNNQTIELELLYRPVDFIINNVQWEVVNGSGASASIIADQNDPTTALLTGLTYKNIAEQDAQPVYEEVTVRVSAEGKSAEAKVRVTPWMPKSVAFDDGSEAEMTMIVGESHTFQAHIEPTYSILNDLNWYSTASATPTMPVATDIGSYTFHATAEMIEQSPVTITARSSDSYYTYIQGTRKINVVPRYVESIAFDSATHTMDQGQTWTPSMTINPSNATFQNYTLTSSNPELLTISGNTITANPDYEMNNASETVTLTATSAGFKEDGTYATATCQVTVNRVIDITGWYYYTDGTCTETYNSSKIVAGIVFSTNDITSEDGTIDSAYSGGLVVGVDQYTSKWRSENADNLMLTSTETTLAKGYSNTNILKNEGAATYPIVNNITAGVLPNVAKASSWYIPSYKEMQMIMDNLTKVNESLSAINKTTICDNTSSSYWTSSQQSGVNGKAYYYRYPYGGPWGFTTQWFTSSCGVRYIFAIKPVNP